MQRAALRWQKRGSDTGQMQQAQAGKERAYRRLSEPGSPQFGMSPYIRPFLQGSSLLASTLRIRGVPLDTTEEDIADFFSGVKLATSPCGCFHRMLCLPAPTIPAL